MIKMHCLRARSALSEMYFTFRNMASTEMHAQDAEDAGGKRCDFVPHSTPQALE